MIHRLTTLRGMDDLRISSLASYLADTIETVEELINENIQLKKKLAKLEGVVVDIEERLDQEKSEEAEHTNIKTVSK